ncbi:MAG: hypothetical protein DRP47_12805, partial [Candidatus Zixiibacteriota bacterium]
GPGGSATYAYSFDGKRISKYANGTLYDFTYHKSLLLEEYAENQGRINKYVIGLNNIGRANSQGKYQPYILDMQRSVIGIVSNGQLQQAYSYTPYGKTDYTKNTNMPSTIQYLSRQYDTETGDYYLIIRYYNADRGTFNSPDQYQYVDSTIPFTWNLYQYGYSNPLVNMDPEGREIKDIDGQRYQLVPVSGKDELFPIHQGYYDILNKLIGTNGGSITIFDNNGKEHKIRFTKQELQKQRGAIVLFESRFLSLYGEKRGLDYVQITTAAAEFSSNFVAAATSVPGMGALMRMKWLASGLGAYTAGTMSYHFGERLAERQESGSGTIASTLGATSDALLLSELYGAVTNRDIITGENAGYSIEKRSGILGGFVGGIFGGWQLASERGFVRITGEAESVASKRTVLGKWDPNTKNIKGIQPGENSLLKHLPDQGSPKLNWKQNSSVLRREMNKGLPFRDAHVDSGGKLLPGSPDGVSKFIDAERNLLRNHGWAYDPKTTLWSPPARN